ncbi:hypothetical protein CEXT_564811 [Caerostris extrusa]|uniref:Uncharacterized protein n=1 Tax=Caerostris extrusa TaxID=172846 RepID=A0AAV4VW66_CAEEX|nr:hypothetical protein CEXT_564811 [Caerostris extrusa]
MNQKRIITVTKCQNTHLGVSKSSEKLECRSQSLPGSVAFPVNEKIAQLLLYVTVQDTILTGKLVGNVSGQTTFFCL